MPVDNNLPKEGPDLLDPGNTQDCQDQILPDDDDTIESGIADLEAMIEEDRIEREASGSHDPRMASSYDNSFQEYYDLKNSNDRVVAQTAHVRRIREGLEHAEQVQVDCIQRVDPAILDYKPLATSEPHSPQEHHLGVASAGLQGTTGETFKEKEDPESQCRRIKPEHKNEDCVSGGHVHSNTSRMLGARSNHEFTDARRIREDTLVNVTNQGGSFEDERSTIATLSSQPRQEGSSLMKNYRDKIEAIKVARWKVHATSNGTDIPASIEIMKEVAAMKKCNAFWTLNHDSRAKKISSLLSVAQRTTMTGKQAEDQFTSLIRVVSLRQPYEHERTLEQVEQEIQADHYCSDFQKQCHDEEGICTFSMDCDNESIHGAMTMNCLGERMDKHARVSGKAMCFHWKTHAKKPWLMETLLKGMNLQRLKIDDITFQIEDGRAATRWTRFNDEHLIPRSIVTDPSRERRSRDPDQQPEKLGAGYPLSNGAQDPKEHQRRDVSPKWIRDTKVYHVPRTAIKTTTEYPEVIKGHCCGRNIYESNPRASMISGGLFKKSYECTTCGFTVRYPKFFKIYEIKKTKPTHQAQSTWTGRRMTGEPLKPVVLDQRPASFMKSQKVAVGIERPVKAKKVAFVDEKLLKIRAERNQEKKALRKQRKRSARLSRKVLEPPTCQKCDLKGHTTEVCAFYERLSKRVCYMCKKGKHYPTYCMGTPVKQGRTTTPGLGAVPRKTQEDNGEEWDFQSGVDALAAGTNPNLVCFKCRSGEHSTAKCHYKLLTRRPCFYCHIGRHAQSECVTKTKARETALSRMKRRQKLGQTNCRKCYTKGHTDEECMSYKKMARHICHICMTGFHFPRDCLETFRSTTASTVKPDRCAKCNLTGHLSSECIAPGPGWTSKPLQMIEEQPSAEEPQDLPCEKCESATHSVLDCHYKSETSFICSYCNHGKHLRSECKWKWFDETKRRQGQKHPQQHGIKCNRYECRRGHVEDCPYDDMEEDEEDESYTRPVKSCIKLECQMKRLKSSYFCEHHKSYNQSLTTGAQQSGVVTTPFRNENCIVNLCGKKPQGNGVYCDTHKSRLLKRTNGVDTPPPLGAAINFATPASSRIQQRTITEEGRSVLPDQCHSPGCQRKRQQATTHCVVHNHKRKTGEPVHWTNVSVCKVIGCRKPVVNKHNGLSQQYCSRHDAVMANAAKHQNMIAETNDGTNEECESLESQANRRQNQREKKEETRSSWKEEKLSAQRSKPSKPQGGASTTHSCLIAFLYMILILHGAITANAKQMIVNNQMIIEEGSQVRVNAHRFIVEREVNAPIQAELDNMQDAIEIAEVACNATYALISMETNYLEDATMNRRVGRRKQAYAASMCATQKRRLPLITTIESKKQLIKSMKRKGIITTWSDLRYEWNESKKQYSQVETGIYGGYAPLYLEMKTCIGSRQATWNKYPTLYEPEEGHKGQFGLFYELVGDDINVCMQPTQQGSISGRTPMYHPFLCVKTHQKNQERIDKLSQHARKCELEVQSFREQRKKANDMYETLKVFFASELNHVTDHDIVYNFTTKLSGIGELQEQEEKPKEEIIPQEEEAKAEESRSKRDIHMNDNVKKAVLNLKRLIKNDIKKDDLAACEHATHFEVPVEDYAKAMKIMKMKPKDSEDDTCLDYATAKAESLEETRMSDEAEKLEELQMVIARKHGKQLDEAMKTTETKEERKQLYDDSMTNMKEEISRVKRKAIEEALTHEVNHVNNENSTWTDMFEGWKRTYETAAKTLKREICYEPKEEDMYFYEKWIQGLRIITRVVLNVNCTYVKEQQVKEEAEKKAKEHARRVKRDVFNGGFVESASEATPLRFIGAFLSMLIGTGMSGNHEEYISKINSNRITINELNFNQHKVYNNTVENRHLVVGLQHKLKNMDEDLRIDFYTQHAENTLLSIRLSIETQSNNINNVLSAIQSIITTSKVGTTSTFSITAKEVEETKKVILRDFYKRVNFNYDTQSEVKINNENKLVIYFYPEHDQKLHTTYKITPIPIFEGGYRYTPDVEEKYVAVEENKKNYYRLTETEYNSCNRFRRCVVNTPSRSMKNSKCGIGSAMEKVVQTCEKTYNTNMEPFVQTLGNGTIYSTEKEIEMSTHCLQTYQLNEKADHVPQYEENEVSRVGYFETAHDCTVTIKPYDLQVVNRVPRVVEIPMDQPLDNLVMKTNTGIVHMNYNITSAMIKVADLSKIKDIDNMPLLDPEWSTHVQSWAAGWGAGITVITICISLIVLFVVYNRVIKRRQAEMYTKVELNMTEAVQTCRKTVREKKNDDTYRGRLQNSARSKAPNYDLEACLS